MRKSIILGALLTVAAVILWGFVIAICITAMQSCGSSRRLEQSTATSAASEQVVVDRGSESARQTTEHSSQTTASQTDTERVTSIVENTVITDFSPPDSLGNQHKVRQTNSTKQTNETERAGSSASSQNLNGKETTEAAADTTHIDAAANASQESSAATEKERKRGAGGYIWAIGVGAAAVIIIAFRKKIWGWVLKLIV